MPRYVIVGAGAVGGAIGGALALTGSDVVLVARGAHLDAIRDHGLTLITPDATHRLKLRVEARAEDVTTKGDVVIVATKSQDTESALAGLNDTAIPIVCAQNGVVNERVLLGRFANVYGMVVYAPMQHLEPGVVSIHGAPHFGGLDVGRSPNGHDAVSAELCGDLVRAGFDAREREDITRWKYGKLLTNLGGVLQAIGGSAAMKAEWVSAITNEALACFEAAKIDSASVAEVQERFAALREALHRGGGSTWQSLERGQPMETEHLNGEIVQLGIAHGVPTPLNAALVAIAERATKEKWRAGEHAADLTPLFHAAT